MKSIINNNNTQIPYYLKNISNNKFSKEDFNRFPKKKINKEKQNTQKKRIELEYEEKLDDYNQERNSFKQKAHMNYIKDNFQYMNGLIEEHFKKNLIQNDEEINKFVKKDFDKFQNQLIEDFTLFKNRQKVFLERLQDKFFILNRKKNNMKQLEENAELQSEPLYQGENINNIFLEMPQNKYNLIINTPGDTKTELINNNESNYYKNKLCHNLIQCMGNTNKDKKNNFHSPENKFIQVNNAKISIDYYHKAKNEFNRKKEKELEEKQKEEQKLDEATKTINFQNKLFDIKYKNYTDDINEIKNINEQNMNIINDIKNKMTKDQLFEDLTYKQLNIFQKNEDEIKDILYNKNNKFDYYNNKKYENEKDSEEYLKKLNDLKEKYEQDFNNINDEIDKLKKKYKQKSKNQNKKRNKSGNITKRKYYNDNPNHYHYNYDRSSIDIKKKLNRYL